MTKLICALLIAIQLSGCGMLSIAYVGFEELRQIHEEQQENGK